MLTTLAQATPPAPGLVGTVLDMIVKGGWIMVPLALTSLVAMTIVAERFLITRRTKLVPPGLLETLVASRDQPDRALAACQGAPSPLAAVILAGLRPAKLTRERQEAQMAEAAQRELRKLKHHMRLLSCLPQAATMLGLLGTVIGMIRTFTVIAASGEALGKTERLAQGIYEAWSATAAGLAIAIPTIIAYHLLQARLDHASAALDSAATLWLDSPPTPTPTIPQERQAVAAPAPITQATPDVPSHDATPALSS